MNHHHMNHHHMNHHLADVTKNTMSPANINKIEAIANWQ
jgi:hypothetical protein